MTGEELIPNRAYVYFAIKSDKHTREDYQYWLGMEPDEYYTGKITNTPFVDWEISTPMIIDPDLERMIQEIVARLVPIKARLIAFREEFPDLIYVLEVVLYKGDGTPGLHLTQPTLRFLSEIGAVLDCDIYRE